MRDLAVAALTFACLVARSVGAWADGPTDTLELDEETRVRCLGELRASVKSGEFWPAMHAAEALTLDGHGAEVGALLGPKLQDETDEQRRCGLARELVRAGDLARMQVMLDILAGPNPYGHVHACESLFKVGEIGDGVLLRRTMARTDAPRSAIMAAAALSRWGNAEALALLRRSIADEDEATARIAAWVLARAGDPSDLPSLRSRGERFKDPLTRAYFEHATAALGARDGLSALLRNLGHADPAVRVVAAEFAAAARATEAKDVLVRLLDDPSLDVRIRTAQALLQLARPRPPTPSEDVSRDVFVADAKNPRYSEGSVIVLRDGRLLHATTEFLGSGSDFGSARLIAVESTDGGRNWGPRRVLQENVGLQNVMSATLRRLTGLARFDGPIGLFYLVKNSPSDLHVFLRTSDDDGATFSDSVRVTDRPGYHVLNNDRVTVLSSGRLVVPVAFTDDVLRRGSRFVSTCYMSEDRGKTWRRSKSEVDCPKRGAMEPEVVECADGRLLLQIRTQTGQIMVSDSADGGETWSGARPWGVRAPEAPSTVRRLPSTGHWLLIWNDCFRDNKTKAQRTPLTAAVSTDEGKKWTYRRDLETSDTHAFAYTSVAFHKGRVLLTYYVRDEATGRISSRFRSIPIAWFYGGGEPR
jgi:sialidase-1